MRQEFRRVISRSSSAEVLPRDAAQQKAAYEKQRKSEGSTQSKSGSIQTVRVQIYMEYANEQKKITKDSKAQSKEHTNKNLTQCNHT